MKETHQFIVTRKVIQFNKYDIVKYLQEKGIIDTQRWRVESVILDDNDNIEVVIERIMPLDVDSPDGTKHLTLREHLKLNGVL